MADEEANVLIFPAPCFSVHEGLKRQKLYIEGDDHYHHGLRLKNRTPCWTKHRFKFDGKILIPAKSENEDCGLSCYQNLTERDESETMLEYDISTSTRQSGTGQVWPLLNLSLDSEFVESGVQGNFPDGSGGLCAEKSFIGDTGSEGKMAAEERNAQAEFELITATSQRLMLQTQCYFDSDTSCSLSEPGCATNAKTLYPDCIREDVKVDSATHRFTADDFYTQNWPIDSQSTSVMLDSTSTTSATSERHSDSSKSSDNMTEFRPTVPDVADRLTKLANCTQEDSIVNIFFIVIQVNPVREIKIKTGINVNQFVSLSSVLAADESKSLFKITLWREAARWTEKMNPGDLVDATGIKIQKWRDEFIGQTIYHTGFFNLHQPVNPLSPHWLRVVTQQRLNELIAWSKKEHHYLFRSKERAVVQFKKIDDLRDGEIVHFRGLLAAVNTFTGSKNAYSFGSRQLSRISLVLAERPGHEVSVCLWGKQGQCSVDLQESIGWVWELRYLMAKSNTSSGTMYLHTTPKTTKQRLEKHHSSASQILSHFEEGTHKKAKKFPSMKELLGAKYNGLAEVSASIYSFSFSSGPPELVITLSDWDNNLKEHTQFIESCVYLGCSVCARRLNQDENGVYCQCVHCVANTVNYTYSCNYYYKPFEICLHDNTGMITVQITPGAADKLLCPIPAKVFSHKKGVPCSEKCVGDFIALVKRLLSSGQQAFLLMCHTVLDENSFVEQRTFSLHYD